MIACGKIAYGTIVYEVPGDFIRGPTFLPLFAVCRVVFPMDLAGGGKLCDVQAGCVTVLHLESDNRVPLLVDASARLDGEVRVGAKGRTVACSILLGSGRCTQRRNKGSLRSLPDPTVAFVIQPSSQ